MTIFKCDRCGAVCKDSIRRVDTVINTLKIETDSNGITSSRITSQQAIELDLCSDCVWELGKFLNTLRGIS